MAITSTARVASFNPLDPIGSILDEAFSSAEKSLEKAVNSVQNATSAILEEAARRATELIASLKAAYEDELNKTYEKADKLIKESLDSLDELITDITKKEVKALENLADRIENIVKFSPLSNWWLPLLNRTSPNFFAVDIDPNKTDGSPTLTKVMITFDGNFAYSDRPGCEPSFELNNKTYKPTANTTKQLKFDVEISSDDPKLEMDRYSFLSGTLKVTWKSGYFTWTTSSYKTLLGMLPGSVGKITAIYSESMKTQDFTSNPITVNRNKNHWQKTVTNISADSGWKVTAGSGNIKWEEKVGDQINAAISNYGPDYAECTYASKDGSGRFRVTFQESQVIPSYTEELKDPRWGSTHIFKPQHGAKIEQINFVAFTGETFQFQPRTDHTNAYIELREFDDTIQVSVKNAKDVSELALARFKKTSEENAKLVA